MDYGYASSHLIQASRMYFARNGTDADGEFHGLALKRAWISATAANYTKEVTKTSFRKNLAGPCDNCKALIQLFQADSSSFDALRGFEVLYP